METVDNLFCDVCGKIVKDTSNWKWQKGGGIVCEKCQKDGYIKV